MQPLWSAGSLPEEAIRPIAPPLDACSRGTDDLTIKRIWLEMLALRPNLRILLNTLYRYDLWRLCVSLLLRVHTGNSCDVNKSTNVPTYETPMKHETKSEIHVFRFKYISRRFMPYIEWQTQRVQGLQYTIY